MRATILLALWAGAISFVAAQSVSVVTTSGTLLGVQDNGVRIFRGVRFGQAPVRWAAPVAFQSTATLNATTFGATCVQQFPQGSDLVQQLFNNPSNPPVESEDCLFLNVWAPQTAQSLPVVIWIYGGSLAFGSASVPMYDGAILARNQSVIVVSVHYRTNVFGFPASPDLAVTNNNFGFMDQELAMTWVQNNIAKFGGDPKKVTIMGESAGSLSVSIAIARHAPGTAPFRAGIMFSGAQGTLRSPTFDSFNAFATAVGCTQSPGTARLACLRQVTTQRIRSYTNSAASGTFRPLVDNVTVVTDPLLRLRNRQTANVPFLIGNMQDDGTLFTIGQTNLAAYLQTTFGGVVTAAQVRPLYPGLNDTQIIWAVARDFTFLCPSHLWASAAVGAGISNVFRYSYGAVWADLQKFPNAGAWHSSELFSVFGTYNRSTATAAEATLSSTIQTAIANFIKDPTVAPAPNWPKYLAGSSTNTLAKLAYSGNVLTSNVVQAVGSTSLDGPCSLWDQFLDVRA
ncbi:Carboxylic ester hydrolase [Mycena kentingensis (nom. inval.)]|nr:Carboxylic ester hydrolase [Mycena kentingensis (nom. inval.)]